MLLMIHKKCSITNQKQCFCVTVQRVFSILSIKTDHFVLVKEKLLPLDKFPVPFTSAQTIISCTQLILRTYTMRNYGRQIFKVNNFYFAKNPIFQLHLQYSLQLSFNNTLIVNPTFGLALLCIRFLLFFFHNN